MRHSVSTTYDIFELSADGLLKRPEIRGYGASEYRFGGPFASMDDVDRAIEEDGGRFAEYVVLTIKQVSSE